MSEAQGDIAQLQTAVATANKHLAAAEADAKDMQRR
jgi:hypothetical protein